MDVYSSLQPEDISKSCRICLTPKTNLKSLTNNYFDSKSYFFIYYKCIGKRLIKSNFCPMLICEYCEKELLESYTFKKKCLRSAEFLSKWEKEKLPEINKTQTDKMKTEKEIALVGEKIELSNMEIMTNNAGDSEDNMKKQKDNNNLSKKIWICKTCSREFKRKCNYTYHLSRNSCQIKEETETDIYKCEECNKVYTRLLLYRNHISNGHRKLCSHCGKMVANINYKTHIEVHENAAKNIKPYSCNECNLSFLYQGSLIKHRRIHSNDKRYECEYCHEKFMIWSQRRAHIHRVHLKTAVFTCNSCDKKFIHGSAYLQHIRRIHTMDFRYKCDTCDMKFVISNELKKHKLSHSDERKFKCDYCSKSFKSLNGLRTHIMIHTGEKNYVCPVCSKEFTQNHVMKAHIIKLHPNYQIPPAGTIVSKKALKRIKEAQENKSKTIN